MMLGARTAAWAKSGGGVPTAADYVQNGLVAMWDGIENAGWGVHNDEIVAPIDLIRNFAYDSEHSSGAFVIGDNWFGLNTTALGVDYISFYNERVDEKFPMSPAACTLEMVAESIVSPLSGGFRNYVIVGGKGDGNVSHLYFGEQGLYQAGVFPLGVRRFGKQATLNVRYSISWSIVDGIPVSVSLNGVEYTDFKIEGYPNDNIGKYIQFGRSRLHSGKWFNVRIHDRVLTHEEISANYAIDKARFNLP